MCTFNAIIFDFNGVLLLDTPLHRKAFDEVSIEIRHKPFSDDKFNKQLGRTNKMFFTYLLEHDMSDQEVEQWAIKKELLYQKFCLEAGNKYQLAPGAVDLLDKLVERKITRTIATSSPKMNVDFYVKHLQIDKWFDVEKIICDDGSFPGKPTPEIYLKAAQILNVRPSDCVVIEDSLSGVTSAHHAGIGYIVAINNDETMKSQFLQNGAKLLISNLNDFDNSILK